MPQLKASIDGDVAHIVLDNPPQNRLSPQWIDEFEDALNLVGASGARALLLRAEGPNFCVGGDIEPWPQMTTRELRQMFTRFLSALNRFERLPIPTVAAVQGGCIGGGLELAVRADVIIAGETARFANPETTLGLLPLLGGAYRLAERMGLAKATAFVLTAEPAQARDMERHGIVHRVVPDADLAQEATTLAGKLASGATRALAAHKALMQVWSSGGAAAADDAVLDIAMPLFDSEDVKSTLPIAVDLLKTGKPRPVFAFKGR